MKKSCLDSAGTSHRQQGAHLRPSPLKCAPSPTGINRTGNRAFLSLRTDVNPHQDRRCGWRTSPFSGVKMRKNGGNGAVLLRDSVFWQALVILAGSPG